MIRFRISLLLIILFVLYSVDVYNQEIRYDRVDFQESPQWNEVLKQAKRSGKIIFLDGYTSWCQPCKRMDKQVFTQSKVANYFNQKFINVKYDMEKGEGVTLKEKYGVGVFPTYLFVTGNGEVIHRIVGAYFGDGEFLDYSRMAVTPGQSYADLQERYKKGERNSEFIFSYFKALRLAGEQVRQDDIVQDYLALMSKDHFMDRSYWDIVRTFLKDPASREFNILLNNREEIGEAIGMEEVNRKIFDVFNDQLNQMNQVEGNKISRQEEEMLIHLLQDADFPGRNELLARALTTHHFRNGDYYEYAGVVDAFLDFRLYKKSTDPLKEFDRHANVFHRVVLDKNLLQKALRWADFTCTEETDPEKLKMYRETKRKLEEKIGRK